MAHTIDHAHVHVDDLAAVAITTGGIRVIHLSGVASCPSELWRVDIVPNRSPLATTAPDRIAMDLRSAPPRRRGRFRSVKVPFEAIIEDRHTTELELHFECQPAVVLPVLEADGSFGAGARASAPRRGLATARAVAHARTATDAARGALHALRDAIAIAPPRMAVAV
ncbi:hypothetical protein GCM10009819_19800 [Agromyces tropicus]|uniref:Uncharacterized protein n=1 Tax=Agromyces tropicus TaxID=555371 RepID=A0ABP5G1C7_9MICO